MKLKNHIYSMYIKFFCIVIYVSLEACSTFTHACFKKTKQLTLLCKQLKDASRAMHSQSMHYIMQQLQQKGLHGCKRILLLVLFCCKFREDAIISSALKAHGYDKRKY